MQPVQAQPLRVLVEVAEVHAALAACGPVAGVVQRLKMIVSAGAAGPVVVAATVPNGMVAAVGHQVLRLRWRDEVPPVARELLGAWLVSEHAARALNAEGAASSMGGAYFLTGSTLLNLPVPYPNETVIAALESLGRVGSWYRTRATAVDAARNAVFAARSYSKAVPLLLEAQRVEGERVTAAEDSQKFEYLVRNYFPHPIALRRERLLLHEHGKERLEETLECAEHLVHYLAVCSLVQLQAIRPEESFASSQLRSTISSGALRFSWGASWSTLLEAVAATRALPERGRRPSIQAEDLRK